MNNWKITNRKNHMHSEIWKRINIANKAYFVINRTLALHSCHGNIKKNFTLVTSDNLSCMCLKWGQYYTKGDGKKLLVFERPKKSAKKCIMKNEHNYKRILKKKVKNLEQVTQEIKC